MDPGGGRGDGEADGFRRQILGGLGGIGVLRGAVFRKRRLFRESNAESVGYGGQAREMESNLVRLFTGPSPCRAGWP